jgi:Ca-activated chloride channel family protein
VPVWAWLAGAAAVLLLVAAVMLLRSGSGGGPTVAARPTASATAPPTATLLPPAPQQALADAAGNLYIEYILDASGSMLEKIGSRTKLAIAREVLAGHLRSQPNDANFGLRAYGHRVHYTETAKSCQDIELVAPVQPGQGERIAVWLAGMQAQGMSPIGLSLRQAAADFEMELGRDNRIVLISDGKETCDIDPCQEVAALQQRGLKIIIHVIGLNLDAEARTQLQCVARQSGGTYLDARTTKELRLALLQVSQLLPPGPTPATGGGQATAEIEPSPTNEPSPTVSPTAGPPTATATPVVVAPTATRARPRPTAGVVATPVRVGPSTGGGVAKPR